MPAPLLDAKYILVPYRYLGSKEEEVISTSWCHTTDQYYQYQYRCRYRRRYLRTTGPRAWVCAASWVLARVAGQGRGNAGSRGGAGDARSSKASHDPYAA